MFPYSRKIYQNYKWQKFIHHSARREENHSYLRSLNTPSAVKGFLSTVLTLQNYMSTAFSCSCLATVRQKGIGYTNVCNHVMQKQLDYNLVISIGRSRNSSGENLKSFRTPKTQHKNDRCEIVVHGLCAFFICEDDIIWRYVKNTLIYVNTPLKWFYGLIKQAERKVCDVLVEQFGIVLDTWNTTDNTH